MAGTASHVGKSTVVAGLLRALSRRGVDAAPFKAQNMSNNARVAVIPGGKDAYGEIGVSQAVQARAAEVTPTTDHNPVLLKPSGGGESQVIVQGRARATVPAGTYYESHWETARAAAIESFERLAATHDVIVAEGAGSIAEINLADRDLANVETARFADARIVLVGDIERGGVFASLYGTLELLPDDLRERVVGLLVNKFRGDRSLLDPGLCELESKTGRPVLGVLPHDDPGLPEEDSLSAPAVGDRGVLGEEDGIPTAEAATVAVPRWPHLSNATDLEPLASVPGVRVAYVPLDATLATADAVVLPGTKNTVDDLRAAREEGFDDTLRSFEGPIVGVCGGYQMLGERIENAHVEGTGSVDTVRGFGLLPMKTVFSPEKRVQRRSCGVDPVPPLRGASGRATGYEIHMGTSTVTGDHPEPLEPGSVAQDGVLGTYLHGLFENRSIRRAFGDAAFGAAGISPPMETGTDSDPYEAAADLLETHLSDQYRSLLHLDGTPD
ncbi:cobyric acid synthase [Halanaeroarchaeum sulfurireducens]|uniref:Probable cobyric acid synthase n=1 Tax=Halanaeroarchaeum sulfurireducens TaxID=1604004 RepID=A0A0F7PAY4_9EURY|nr:cobyric acid synthase [Halanaeroarchaeum sulfurireducens]ALG81206.1 cobyric acid synthase [Halanaeroarchaeum sulfurireducens]